MIVYVWEPHGTNVGHAAAQVQREYISWWPEQTIKLSGVFSSHAPHRRRTLWMDKDDEEQNADHAIVLRGLDEAAILEWWAGFGLSRNGQALEGPMPRYQLMTQNCSSVVAEALQRGGADRFVPRERRWDTWNFVWTPCDVERYARAIARGLPPA